MSPTSRTPFHSPSYESARKISPWPAKHSLDLTDRMIVWYSGLWAEPVRVSLVGSVEGPRFDLDLRDSISAQVDETVPVYSILNTSIHCRTSTSSPRSTRTPRLRGEGGARCFHHRQALPAGGESEWEDQEPQHRGHLNILRWLLFSPSRLQHSDPPRLRVTDIANPLPQSVVRIRPQNLQCRSITALSRGALHPRPSP